MTQLGPVTLTPGMALYKYQLVSRIGHGYFGEVWRAHDVAVRREYAIKILQPGVPLDARLREAQIGNRLKHRNLVYVHHADVVPVGGENAVILAMDYHPSGSVETLGNVARYLPLPDVLRISRDILQGLEYLHARSFYHNDIKPGNILLGPQKQAMLSDYGITGVSSKGAPTAAPDTYLIHRAPEVVATSSINVSSDIFQVGMTLARLLIHLDHFGAIRARIGDARYQQYIAAGMLLTHKDFGDHIPAAVRRVILKAIHPDPANRYSNAIDMRRDLEKLSYSGFWTVDKNGNEVGKCGKYEFSYSAMPVAGEKFDLICKKRNVASGARAQRISRFCERGMTQKQVEKRIAQFKQFVVIGK